MYPYIRAIIAVICARKMSPMGLYDTHVSHHRAWPWDTDMFGELNNGRILTLFELGRWQSTVRVGMIAPFLKGKMGFAVAGVSVRYRRRIPLFQRYRMQTRIIGYDDRFIYVDQTMWQGETCANQLLLRAAIREKSKTVPPVEFLKRMGYPTDQPDLPPWVNAWIEADNTRPWPPDGGPVFHN